jgi:Flp pilus assembly protein TadD
MRTHILPLVLTFAAASLTLSGCRTASQHAATSDTPEAAAPGKDFTARFSLAKLHEQEGDFTGARRLYEELLQAHPNHAGAQHRLGIVEIRLGEVEKGLDLLRLAEAAAPDNIAILNDLGYACLTTGRPELAQQVLVTALEINPHDERAINNLAMAYGLTGQFDKAFATFRRKLNEAEALSNLGFVATQAGDLKFATDCYSRALSLNPDLNEAGEALAQLADLERQVDQQKAIAAATQRNQSAGSGSGIQLTGGKEDQQQSGR